MTKTEQSFYSLLCAGLWEDVSVHGERFIVSGLSSSVDWGEVYRMAEEQSVIGLIAAGLEHLSGTRPDKKAILPFLTSVIAQEQRNSAMNEFIGWLMARLREEDVQAVLIKGQGVAQCYTRPLWRAAGDVDLLLNTENYKKAKKLLCPLASRVETENTARKHLGMTLGGFEVELHGTFKSGLAGCCGRIVMS